MSATEGAWAPTRARIAAGLARRYRAERLFRGLGLSAVGFAGVCVLVLLSTILSQGLGALKQSRISLEIALDPATLGIPADAGEDGLRRADYRAAIAAAMRGIFPEASGRAGRRAMMSLVSPQAEVELRDAALGDPSLLGRTVRFRLLASADADIQYRQFHESGGRFGRIDDTQAWMLARLVDRGLVGAEFNRGFFTNGDSRNPEAAGVLGALMGSFYTMLVVLALSFPLGVCAALYLEEFAPRNRWTDLVEVNINNLAAVPSIIFGLLGLAIFLNLAGLPRSAPLVGGLVLTLMTLPTVIIAARAAIRSVPTTLREAALAMGASRTQMVFHQVIPAALPGMLTGTIIGLAQALGETAPLLMIGMVAFIVDVPQGVLDSATTLPVQIYLWADSPERAFAERTSAAIMVLLGFLLVMNISAVLLRKRFEKRW